MLQERDIIVAAAGVFAVFLAAVFWKYHCRKREAGEEGELRTAKTLKRLSKRRFTVINDVMLQTPRGTSQIDHIVVSVYGIFIIETKNYGGLITGSENSEYWYQHIGTRRNEFGNPVKQNYGHVRAVRYALADFEKEAGERFRYIPVVVFQNRCRLRVETENEHVVYEKRLRRFIRRIKGKKLYSSDVVKELAGRLEECNISGRRAKKKHVKEVKKIAARREKLISRRRCPKCGGRLKKKRGKYGVYWRCRNFPDCSFTKSADFKVY